ncbi:hypothetical protein G9A89_016002 [Geosiphon pyriformis]|nr:hypothetical protein G9A89_016002 [Geosiphon pyriformis]
MEAKQSIISDDLKDWANQMEMESSTPSPISGVANGGAWMNVNGRQRFSEWVVSPLVPVALCNVPLDTFSDNIKSAVGIFGVITSVKLKSAGLWQYAVVYFKDTFSAAAVLTYWSVLVRKDNIKILSVVNQNNVISLRDAFKAKLINFPFAFEISDLVSQIGLDYLVVDYKVLPPLPPKLSFNSAGGPKIFKSSFVRSKFYAKAVAYVVSSVAAAVDMDLNFGAFQKCYTSALNLLGALVVLITKLLSAPPTVDVSIKESMAELANQNKSFAVITSMMQKRMIHLKKKCKKACLDDVSDNDNMDDNNDDDNNNENQLSSIKSNPDWTAKWMSEENLFYAFNLTDDNYDIDELAINTSELTRKKKKAKIDFVLDPNKASKSTANNNKPPKTKVFKNSPKLEPPKIIQKFGSYSVVKDLIETPAHITFGQLITHPQFKKALYKLLISKKKTPKTNKCFHQAELADNNNVTPLICKAQMAGYFIDLILDSELSVSVIAKHFLDAIDRKIDEPSI